MPTPTIRPVLESGGNITVGAFDGGRLYLHYNDGVAEGDCEPASLCLDYGGGDERQTGLVATCGMLKEAKEKIGAVASASAGIDASDIDAVFAQRHWFSCEEMREDGNVSDYVSFADYVGPVSYGVRTSDIRRSDVVFDHAPVHWEDSSHNIQTEYTTAWVVPVTDNLLAKRRKGDMVEVRIEYVNSEPYGGGTQQVRKCSVQRFDLGYQQPSDGGLMFRKVYDKGSTTTAVRIATRYGMGTVSDIKTSYKERGNLRESPLSLLLPCVSRTGVFLIAFDKERLVVYRISDTISRFRVTSCRAIHSIGTEYVELGILHRNGDGEPKEVMSEYEKDGETVQSPAKYLVAVHGGAAANIA